MSLVAQAVARHGVTTLTVRGNSMLPTLFDGEQVRLEACDFDLVIPGQIVAVKTENGIVVHRVRYRTALGLLLAGDNNIMLDASIPYESFLGVVTARRKAGGIWSELSMTAQPSSHTKAINVLLPKSWFALLDNSVNYQSLRIQDTSEQGIQIPSHDLAGISPLGLENDEWFIRQLSVGLNNVLCFAEFGPPELARMPVNRVRGIARLSVFDVLEPNAPSSMQDFLRFLDGLVTGSFIAGRLQ
jgi:signal peptidase I